MAMFTIKIERIENLKYTIHSTYICNIFNANQIDSLVMKYTICFEFEVIKLHAFFCTLCLLNKVQKINSILLALHKYYHIYKHLCYAVLTYVKYG